jgi:hypothetical protein
LTKGSLNISLLSVRNWASIAGLLTWRIWVGSKEAERESAEQPGLLQNGKFIFISGSPLWKVKNFFVIDQ